MARPKQLEAHGDVRTDDFYWLRDDGRRSTQVRQYLEARSHGRPPPVPCSVGAPEVDGASPPAPPAQARPPPLAAAPRLIPLRLARATPVPSPLPAAPALQAEASYCNAAMADTDALQEQLYDEMRAAVQEADASAPIRCASGRGICVASRPAVLLSLPTHARPSFHLPAAPGPAG